MNYDLTSVKNYIIVTKCCMLNLYKGIYETLKLFINVFLHTTNCKCILYTYI